MKRRLLRLHETGGNPTDKLTTAAQSLERAVPGSPQAKQAKQDISDAVPEVELDYHEDEAEATQERIEQTKLAKTKAGTAGMKNTGAKKKKKKARKKKGKNVMEDYRRNAVLANRKLTFYSHMLEDENSGGDPSNDPAAQQGSFTNNEHVNRYMDDETAKERGEAPRKDEVVDTIERAESGLNKLDKVLGKMKKIVQDIKSSYMQKEYSKNSYPNATRDYKVK